MTRQQHAAYTKKWRRLRWGDGCSSDPSGYIIGALGNKPVYDEAKSINEQTLEIEETVCSFFGCNKHLSLLETLCGDKCVKHQQGPADITNAISI